MCNRKEGQWHRRQGQGLACGSCAGHTAGAPCGTLKHPENLQASLLLEHSPDEIRLTTADPGANHCTSLLLVTHSRCVHNL